MASVVGGGCQSQLSHNLGWSLFDQSYAYEQLLLYRVFHSGSFCLDALPRMSSAGLTSARPGDSAVLSLHSVLISWQSPSVAVTKV